MLVTEQEIYNIAFNRDLGVGLIKPSQILVAQDIFISDYFNEAFYNALLLNTDNNYTSYIDEYIKPIIAWGTLYNNFEYISTSITDKGIIQMLVENTALVLGRESKNDVKNEIKNTVYRLIKIARQYAKLQKDNDNLLFDVYDEEDLNIVNDLSIIKYIGNDSFNLNAY